MSIKRVLIWRCFVRHKLILVFALLCPLAVSAAQIDMYVACHSPVKSNDDVTVYHVGCNQALDAALTAASRDISPDDKTQLKKVASQYLKQNYQNYMQAYQANEKAVSQGVTQYPAVVFDRHYVIYGTENLTVATRLFNQYIAEHGE